ncbi:Monoglyceride lipase [Hondaea fermentalgiana]|uniref:Monoglyceride lipase n=1 Tax=Hondaea fermentalgiana TaxID=2315210 RepID=A0A2R5GIQ2_9STRA|nr:Monoglyceride lipase [Hondaea fermentalgiana]|eukprot:GBG28533.1 Monoglyceride lipase [Hondaea fermentalgiana]
MVVGPYSLVGNFFLRARESGILAACKDVVVRLAYLAVPAAEVGSFLVFLYVLYALATRHSAKKHSAILLGVASPDREPPHDIMKPHFFQNRQGLWLHHGLIWDESKHGPPVAVAVLLHGHSEHSRRFIHVAEHLNSQGVAVFIMDHQGFGRSEGDRAHVENFMHYVDDVMDFMQNVVWEDHPAWRPLARFLVGHSMGGLIAIHTALRCQDSSHPAHHLSGVMLSAPAVHVDPSRNNAVLTLVGKILDVIAPKLPVISFPAHPSTTFLQVKLHATFDPLNYQGDVRIHQGLELLRATGLALEFAPAFTTPIIIAHGTEDLHCDIRGSREFISLIKSEDKTLMELPNLRHEPWQEVAEVRDPILHKFSSWLLARIKESPQPPAARQLKQMKMRPHPSDGSAASTLCSASSGSMAVDEDDLAVAAS